MCLLVTLFVSCSMAAPPPWFTLHELAPGVWAAVAVPGSAAGANAGFVIGERAVAVVDSFEEPAAAEALLAEIHRRTPLPVRFLINTHYHLDHVAGNSVFAAAGATIVAHENVRAWARTENRKFLGPATPPSVRTTVDSLALPDLVFTDQVQVFLGNRRLQVIFHQGHTGSDAIVVVPDAHAVFAGDLFWNHHLPNLVDARTNAWLASLEQMRRQFAEYTFVPGHGAVGSVSDLRAFEDYLSFLRNQVASHLGGTRDDAALIAAILPALRAHYGSWGFFAAFAERNILQTAAELRGTKRFPGL
jgi:glyoxylase-like metal-dependent hydrolase (beta-lactamase superfamily II)